MPSLKKRLTENLKSNIFGEDGSHSRLRNIKLLKAASSGAIARGINMGSSLISIPLMLNYLGLEQFGIWMAITGFIGFLSFSDLGMGIGLQNALSRCFGTNDDTSPKYYISTSYFLLTAVAIIATLITTCLAHYFPISTLFSVHEPEAISAALKTIQYTLIIFAWGIPVNLISRVLSGYQNAHISNTLLASGRLLGLIFIFFGVHSKLELATLAGGFMAAPHIVQLVYSFLYFRKNPTHIPNWRFIRKTKMVEIVTSGGWVVIAKISDTMTQNLPILIISSGIGTAAAGTYAICQRLFGFAGMIINMSLQSLWPAYGEAYHRGDKKWISGAFKKSVIVTVTFSICISLPFIPFGRTIIELWTSNDQILPSRSLIFAFIMWTTVTNLSVAYTMLLNGTNNFKGQATYGVLVVSIGCIAAYILGTKHGLTITVIIILSFEAIKCLLLGIESTKLIKGMRPNATR